ncbi:MAG: hypothetical protein IR164_11705, partial [Devosia sp.]
MDAYVYIAGPDDDRCAALFDLVSGIGFTGVSSFRGIAQVSEQIARNPICFILCSSVADPRQLRATAAAVRFCDQPSVRFSPLIYLTEHPSIETTMACANMGFDDVVALPQSRAQLRERLEHQVGEMKVYYEASGYFGPDRRRNTVSRRDGADVRQGGPFRRFELIRDARSGISVMREEMGPADAAVATLQDRAPLRGVTEAWPPRISG